MTASLQWLPPWGHALSQLQQSHITSIIKQTGQEIIRITLGTLIWHAIHSRSCQTLRRLGSTLTVRCKFHGTLLYWLRGSVSQSSKWKLWSTLGPETLATHLPWVTVPNFEKTDDRERPIWVKKRPISRHLWLLCGLKNTIFIFLILAQHGIFILAMDRIHP